MSRVKLTEIELRCLREACDKVGLISSLASLRLLLNELGQENTSDAENLRDLQSVGQATVDERNGVPFDVLVSILERRKRLYQDALLNPEHDTLRVWVAMGGSSDGSGTVPLEVAREVVAQYALCCSGQGIDLEEMLGRLGPEVYFKEFCSLWSTQAPPAALFHSQRTLSMKKTSLSQIASQEINFRRMVRGIRGVSLIQSLMKSDGTTPTDSVSSMGKKTSFASLTDLPQFQNFEGDPSSREVDVEDPIFTQLSSIQSFGDCLSVIVSPSTKSSKFNNSPCTIHTKKTKTTVQHACDEYASGGEKGQVSENPQKKVFWRVPACVKRSEAAMEPLRNMAKEKYEILKRSHKMAFQVPEAHRRRDLTKLRLFKPTHGEVFSVCTTVPLLNRSSHCSLDDLVSSLAKQYDVRSTVNQEHCLRTSLDPRRRNELRRKMKHQNEKAKWRNLMYYYN